MTSAANPVRVGVVGLGAWGKNLLRAFYLDPYAEVCIACDMDSNSRERILAQYGEFEVTADVERVLTADIEALVIATPPVSHYDLAAAALEAGKDVFVEKPLVLSVADGERLARQAAAVGRILMVGHIMEYHPAVEWLQEYLHKDGLGRVYYLYATRTNLGKVRDIENAMWSFAPHDISMMSFLLGEHPRRVAAVGQSYLRPGIEDVVFVTLWYDEDRMGHIHTSWLDPHKVRSLTIVGQKQMAVFSDTSPTQRITIFNKGVDFATEYRTYAEYLTLRTGEAFIPQISNAEPLACECRHFLERVRDRKAPRSDGWDGVRVLRVLEAAQKSLESKGMPVDIDQAGGETKP